MSLRDYMQQLVEQCAVAGLPAILERFVLKHGTAFEGARRPKGVRKRAMKMCFRNSANITLDARLGSDYYEGFAMHREMMFPFLHAWNVRDGKVIDTTLRDPEQYQYLGLRFTLRQLISVLAETQVYGLLDPGMINIKLLRSIDDGLVEEAMAVRRIREVQSLKL
jgi:hypothetical protein